MGTIPNKGRGSGELAQTERNLKRGVVLFVVSSPWWKCEC